MCVLQLCEVLCACIDTLLDKAGRESERLLLLGESVKEKILLHLSEPLQFLHNLDIAHVFEHFYRWVESALYILQYLFSLPSPS